MTVGASDHIPWDRTVADTDSYVGLDFASRVIFVIPATGVYIVEAEIGLQYGCCIHNCYVFFRAGGVYQRWFDVGSPISASGDLSFVGGTARVGIVY